MGSFTVLPVAAHQNQDTTSGDSASQDEIAVGTVEDLTVENRVKGTTRKYHLLRRQDGKAVPLTGPDVEGLQRGESVALEGRQEGAHFHVRHATELAPPATGPATTSAEVEGTLGIAHGDDFESGRSQYHYHVQDDAGGVTRLNVLNLPSEVRGGSRVRVTGKRSADGVSLDPETVTIESEPAGTSTASSEMVAKSGTSNSVLVIMANFNNTAAPAFTQSQALQVMSTDPGSVAKFFSEVSYGSQQLNVTVTSTWVTMSLSATCSYPSIASAANTAAQKLSAAYTASNYNFVVYVFPWQQSCGWSGLAYVGSPHQSFINGTNAFKTQVVTHEMGHNFGLYHAGSLNCGAASIGGSCTAAEYGDPWDTMGNQRAMHYNAAQKLGLGWISSATVKTHSSGSANYTISPLENGGAATYAVKIPTSNTSRTYWLEYRQPIGFDAPISAYPNNGVQVRVTDPFEWASGSDDTEILDMKPGTPGNFTDSALVVGQSFLDSTYGVNIIVTGATASAVTVSVTKGGTLTATTTTAASSLNPANAGSSVTFTATVSGSAPTGTVNFKDGGTSIGGCSAVGLSGIGNSRTAKCITSALTAGSHSIVASYGGDGNNAASSSGTLTQTINGTGSTTSIATSLTPSIIGTSVTFTGTVSGSSPTGTVNFKDGSSSISGCAGVALSGSGNIRTANCATAALAAGNHSITAAYSGDVSNSASTSSAITQTVNNTTTTTTTLTSSRNPSSFGASVTFTVTVTGSIPSGTVAFTDGGAAMSGCRSAALSGTGNTKTAICVTSALSVGTHNIVGRYSGDARNPASSSATLSQSVSSTTSTSVSIVNSSFETPATATFVYNPAGAGVGWTFIGSSGIQRNGSAWGAASAPVGVQTAFIRYTASISQTLNLNAGSYTLSFKAARRNCCTVPYGQPIKVTLDGIQIGALITPPTTSFATFNIPFSVAKSGSHTLSFSGTTSLNNTTFIDEVSIQ